MTEIRTPDELGALLSVTEEAGEVLVVRDPGHRLWLVTQDERADWWAWSWREEYDTPGPVSVGHLMLPLAVLVGLDAPAPTPQPEADREALARVMAGAVDDCRDDHCPWGEHSQDYRDEWLQGADAALAWFAARQPAPVDAETTTEWGVRSRGSEDVSRTGDRTEAERIATEVNYVVPVKRTVTTTPWREVPRG